MSKADDAAEAIRQRAAAGTALSRDAQISARAQEILREKRAAELEALKQRTLAMVRENQNQRPGDRSPATGKYRGPVDIGTRLREHGVDLRQFANMTPQAARASMEARLLAIEGGAITDVAQAERNGTGSPRALVLDENGADALAFHQHESGQE